MDRFGPERPRHCASGLTQVAKRPRKQSIHDLGTMQRGGWVYIMTNRRNGTLYVGVTADLVARVFDHKPKTDPASFTARYGLGKLVYFEGFDFIQEAIEREKQLKAGSRVKKITLIEALNPEWKDLYDAVVLDAEG